MGVVLEQDDLAAGGGVLLQVRDEFARLEIPHADLAEAAAGDDEALRPRELGGNPTASGVGGAPHAPGCG